MHSIRAIALLVTLLACIAFSHATPLQKRSSFKVRTKRNINTAHPDAGPAAMLKAFRKFGFSMAGMKRQNTTGTTPSKAGQTGVVQAVPESNDAEFLEKVTIGGQQMTLDFDTGSSDLWVFSTQLSQGTIGQHAAFDASNSKTFQPQQGATWQISYGDGSGAAGNVGTDTVHIGGATVTSQVVELATAISQSFAQDTNNDGLVGLAFSALNTVQPQPAKTFFDNVLPSLALPVFSVDLRSDGTGTYDFGNIDTSKVQGGNLSTIPVDAQSGFWQFASNSFAVGGRVQQNTAGSPAIADTGTSLMIVDDNVATAYYSQVEGAQNSAQVGGFIYPCNAQLPDLSVAIGDSYMATIPGNMITFAQIDQQACFGGVQSNGGSNMQIYGDTMFRAQYVVFDGKDQALQMGSKA